MAFFVEKTGTLFSLFGLGLHKISSGGLADFFGLD